MPQFIIRKATELDIPIIRSLINTELEHLLERTDDEIREHLDCFWVAACDGKVVGCSSLEVYSKKIAEIRSVVVIPEYRRRDIGEQLVKAAAEEGERLGIPEIFVITANREFFERVGFGPFHNEKFALFWKPRQS